MGGDKGVRVVFNKACSLLFDSSRYDPVMLVCFHDLLDKIWCVLDVPLDCWSASDVLETYSFLTTTDAIVPFVELCKGFFN